MVIKMANEINDEIINNIIKILQDEFICHTIILYGSRARNDFNDISDYDVIGFSDSCEDTQRQSIISSGKYLDLWVYPTKKLYTPEASMVRVKDGVVLKQKDSLGNEFLSLIQKITNKSIPLWEVELQKVWALKMLERASLDDLEGKYRKHWLIYSLLEIYFMVHDIEYMGCKVALYWLQKNDTKFYELFKSMLDDGSLLDTITVVFHIICKEKIFYFMRHGHADENPDDQSRAISLQGQEALSRIKKELCENNFDLIITSLASRTKQTADIIFSEKNTKVVEAKKLYLPLSDKDKLIINNDLKANIKLVPNDLLKTQSKQSWLRYASDALIEIMKICLEHNSKKIVVVGHGVIINLIGLIVEPEREKLLNKSFSPGEGFWLESHFSNKGKP